MSGELEEWVCGVVVGGFCCEVVMGNVVGF